MMLYKFHITLGLAMLLITTLSNAQEQVSVKGQLSIHSHFNPVNDFPLWSGIRYIPQINHQISLTEAKLIDFEASANIFGNLGLKDFQSTSTNGRLKPYRLWARYTTNQFELRAGLQKINFGSASILRPLRWFDQMDPRDPLQLTDGVWGLLGRYYFLNNANIWLWILYNNPEPKGWELAGTHQSVPEAGGRLQHPIGKGETALSYHFRMVDGNKGSAEISQFHKIPEHRIGIDAKFDWIAGFWFETSWTGLMKDMEEMTHQQIVNLGVDYTLGLGNGITIIYEQLIAAYDKRAFRFNNPVTFSLLSARYPMGLLDEVSYITYFDWNNKSTYHFINWQRQYNRLTFHLIGYSNPKNYNIPMQQLDGNLFAGTGVQLMLVFNH